MTKRATKTISIQNYNNGCCDLKNEVKWYVTKGVFQVIIYQSRINPIIQNHWNIAHTVAHWNTCKTKLWPIKSVWKMIHWSLLLTRSFGSKGHHRVANRTVVTIGTILLPAHLIIQFSHVCVAKTYKIYKIINKLPHICEN